MRTVSSDNYISHPEWFSAVLNENVILGFKSALECLGYFQGWIGEDTIDVYATEKGKYDNITYHIVDDLSEIESETVHGIKCASLSQTVNDMIGLIDQVDEQPIIEGLSAYYYENGESVRGLDIAPCNRERFAQILEEAKEYYND